MENRSQTGAYYFISTRDKMAGASVHLLFSSRAKNVSGVAPNLVSDAIDQFQLMTLVFECQVIALHC
jgi:hypothetical protein